MPDKHQYLQCAAAGLFLLSLCSKSSHIGRHFRTHISGINTVNEHGQRIDYFRNPNNHRGAHVCAYVCVFDCLSPSPGDADIPCKWQFELLWFCSITLCGDTAMIIPQLYIAISNRRIKRFHANIVRLCHLSTFTWTDLSNVRSVRLLLRNYMKYFLEKQR